MTSPPTATDLPRLLAGDRLGDAIPKLMAALGPRRVAAGWATVELDRAERELVATRADLGPHATAAAANDGLLGARVRRLRYPGQRDELLLEPATEGPLAAALARHGEGRLVLYVVGDRAALVAARRAGFRLSAASDGPLGPQRQVLVGPRDGPFLILVTP